MTITLATIHDHKRNLSRDLRDSPAVVVQNLAEVGGAGTHARSNDIARFLDRDILYVLPATTPPMFNPVTVGPRTTLHPSGAGTDPASILKPFVACARDWIKVASALGVHPDTSAWRQRQGQTRDSPWYGSPLSGTISPTAQNSPQPNAVVPASPSPRTILNKFMVCGWIWVDYVAMR